MARAWRLLCKRPFLLFSEETRGSGVGHGAFAPFDLRGRRVPLAEQGADQLPVLAVAGQHRLSYPPGPGSPTGWQGPTHAAHAIAFPVNPDVVEQVSRENPVERLGRCDVREGGWRCESP